MLGPGGRRAFFQELWPFFTCSGGGGLAVSPSPPSYQASLQVSRLIATWQDARHRSTRLKPMTLSCLLCGAGLAVSGFLVISLLPGTAGQQPGLPAAQLVATWQGHKASVHAITVAADGKRALSASEDGTLRIWNIATGTSEVVCEYGERVWAAAFLPAGDRVVAGGHDGRLAIFDARTASRWLPSARRPLADAASRRWR